MKKIVLSWVAFALSSFAMAQSDYKYLTVATSSSEKSIELATIQKITFNVSEKQVVVTTSEGEVTFPQSELQKMFFGNTATAIENMAEESEALKVANGVLIAQGNGLLRIYNAGGALQGMVNVEGETRVNLSKYASGVYVVNLGKQTIKFSK